MKMTMLICIFNKVGNYINNKIFKAKNERLY